MVEIAYCRVVCLRGNSFWEHDYLYRTVDRGKQEVDLGEMMDRCGMNHGSHVVVSGIGSANQNLIAPAVEWCCIALN